MFLAERSSKEELEYPLATSNMETLHGIAGKKYCSHSAGWHHQQQMSVSSSQDQHAHLSTSPSSVSTISTFMTANPCQPAFDDAVQSHLEVRSQLQSTADFLNCSFCGYNLPSDDVPPPRGNSCFSTAKRRPQLQEFDFFGSNLEEGFEACTRRSDVDCTLSLGSIVTGPDVCRDSSPPDATILQSRSDSPLLSCNRLQAILALKRCAPDSHLLAAARAEEEVEQGRCTIEGACKRQALIDYAASCSSKSMLPFAHSLIDGPYSSSIYNVSHEWMRRTRFNFDPDMSRLQAAPKMFINASSADSYAHAARLSEEEETTSMSRSSVRDQRSSCRYLCDKVVIGRISSTPVAQNMQINPTSTMLHGGSATDFQIVVKRPVQSIVGPKQYPSDQWQLINGSTSKGRLMHEHQYDMKVMSCWQDAGALSLIDQSSTCAKGQQRHAVTRVCAQCKTMKTPLWRNGPQGPKSLCNACGIRYKKEERRTSGKYPTDSASPTSTISNYRSIMFSDPMNSKERDLINKHHDADDINERPFPYHDIPRHVDAALQLCSHGEGVTDKQLVGAEDENGILACRFGDGSLSDLTSICASTRALLAGTSPLSITTAKLGPGSSAQDVLHRQTSSSSSKTARDFLNCLGVH